MAQLKIQIIVDDQGKVKIKGIEGQIQDIDKSLKTLTSTANILKGALVAAVGVLGIREISRAAKEWVNLSMVQEQAERALKAVMIVNQRYSESFYQSTLKQASALQKLSGIGDETILQGQKMLMIYHNIGNDVMPRATKAMLDLSALMGGDVQQAAIALGRASEGLTEGLRRQGIIIDQQVFELKGFGGVLEEIEKKVSGQAETLAQGSGKWRVLRANIGDAKEGLGDFLTMLATKSGVLDYFIKSTENLTRALKEPVKEIDSFISSIDKLKKEGTLDQWAKQTSIAVVTAFKGMVWGANELFKSVDRVRVGFAAILELSLPKIIENVTSQIDKLEKQINKPEGLLTRFLGQKDPAILEFNQKWLDKLKDQRKEYETLLQAARQMGTDSVKNIEKIDKVFQELLNTLEKIKTGIGSVTEEIRTIDLGTIPVTAQMPELIPVWQGQYWQDLTDNIEKAFVNGMERALFENKNLFKEFFDDVGRMAVRKIAEQMSTNTFRPIFDQMAESFHNFMNRPLWSPVGEQGPMNVPTWGQVAGAGLMGYGAYQQYQAGTLTPGTGALYGAAIGSIVPGIGTVIGGAVGLIAGAFTKRIVPEIDLMFEVIGGEIRLVSEHYKKIGKDRELINQVEQMLQAQIDFYGRIAQITETKMIDFTKIISGKGGEMQFQIGKAIALTPMEFMTAFYEPLTQMYPIFAEDFAKLWIESFKDMTEQAVIAFGQTKTGWREYLGMEGLFPGQELQKIIGIQDEEARLAELRRWLEQAIITKWGANIGMYGGPDIWTEKGIPTPGQAFLSEQDLKLWDEYFQTIKQDLESIQGTFAQSIGNAFLESLETGDFRVFENQLKNRLFEAVQGGFAQIFTSNIIDMFLRPEAGLFGGFGLMNEYVRQLTDPTRQEPITISIQDIISLMRTGFSQIGTILIELQPIWSEFNTGLQGLSDALGINTNALLLTAQKQNEAIDSFIRELTFAEQYAPAISAEAYRYEFEKLYAQAMQNPAMVGEFFNFAKQYLQFGKMYGGDYAGMVEEVISRAEQLRLPIPLEEIASQGFADVVAGLDTINNSILGTQVPVGELAPSPIWPPADVGAYNPSRGKARGGNEAAVIGEAVASAIIPVISQGNIEVRVYIDGKEIKSSFRRLLRDGDVITDIRQIAGNG